MYLCAKLVGIATAILSAGTVSPLVIPYLKNTNSWLFKRDSFLHQYNFQELDDTIDKRLKKLTHWSERFTSAKTTAEGLKKLELDKMKPLFDKIFATEKSIEKLFEKIAETLTDIVKKHTEFVETSTKKLQADKKEQLHKKMKEKYSKFKETLKGWETSLNQISCAIENAESKTECEREKVAREISLFFESVNSLFSSLIAWVGSGSEQTSQNEGHQAVENGQKEGAEKAKQDLEKVKEVLLQSIKDFQTQSVRYGTQLAFAVSNEKIATMLLIVFSAIVKSLSEQIEVLKKSIDENSKFVNTQTEEINKLQKQLESSYDEYSDLKKLESLFQWWQEMFGEKITQNEDERAREENVARRKRRK